MPARTLRAERGQGQNAFRRILGFRAVVCYADVSFLERSIKGRNQSNGAP